MTAFGGILQSRVALALGALALLSVGFLLGMETAMLSLSRTAAALENPEYSIDQAVSLLSGAPHLRMVVCSALEEGSKLADRGRAAHAGALLKQRGRGGLDYRTRARPAQDLFEAVADYTDDDGERDPETANWNTRAQAASGRRVMGRLREGGEGAVHAAQDSHEDEQPPQERVGGRHAPRLMEDAEDDAPSLPAGAPAAMRGADSAPPSAQLAANGPASDQSVTLLEPAKVPQPCVCPEPKPQPDTTECFPAPPPVPKCKVEAPRVCPSGRPLHIPRIVHLVKADLNPTFTIIQWLVVRSVVTYLRPERIFWHTYVTPTGEWYERARPFITLQSINATVEPFMKALAARGFRADNLRAEHLADFARFVLLYKTGGAYLDLDAIPLRPFDTLFEAGFENVLGMAPDGYLGVGLMLAAPKSPLFAAMMKKGIMAFDNNWSTHAVVLMTRIWSEFASSTLVLDKDGFFPLSYSKADLGRLYDELLGDVNGEMAVDWKKSYALHCYNSRAVVENWNYGNGVITLGWLMYSNSNFARAVRPVVIEAIEKGELPDPREIENVVVNKQATL